MKSLSFLAVFVIFLASLTVFPGSADALVGPSEAGLAAMPIMAGIGLLQIFIILFLFLFIPIAFIGMILRLLGFRKEGKGGGWRWNLKQSLFRFVKYLLYHVGLFGLWFIILGITMDGYIDFYYTDLSESYLLFTGGYLITFLIYAIVWSLVGPYLVYLWHQLRGIPTFKPSLGLYIRLALWNIFIFFCAGISFQVIFNRF